MQYLGVLSVFSTVLACQPCWTAGSFRTAPAPHADPLHMRMVGSEGYFGDSTPQVSFEKANLEQNFGCAGGFCIQEHSMQSTLSSQTGAPMLPSNASQYISSNGGTWAICNGVDFAELTSLPHVSFGSAHMYETMR